MIFFQFFSYLLVNPRDRRVVVCESVLCPTMFREVLAKVLFKHFEVCKYLNFLEPLNINKPNVS